MRYAIPSAVLSALMFTTSAQAQEWSGFYAGVHAGYGWTENDTSLVGTNDEGAEVIDIMHDYGLASSFSPDDGGALGGAQMGFNIQSGVWVWGVEADISRLESSAADSNSVTEDEDEDEDEDGEDIVANTAGAKLDWLGTLRLRAGTLLGQNGLVYVTGGLAYARVENSWATSVDEDDEEPRTYFSAKDESWEAGWTIGGGAEFKIAEGVSLRGEYLYYDLGDTSKTVTIHEDNDEPIGLKLKSENTGHAVRAALNFEIGQ